ncbi:membrane protein insertase YidC [Gordonia sinesedis]
MLNFIYYPVSGIMWVWHWVFDKITPDTPGGNGIAWALSVVFLVFTLRAILYKPFVKQIRTTKKMQEINPQLQAIRKKYAKDRVKMTEEMQKLQKEHGFNPLLGCLPMLLQIPVFIGLFHVLRSFNRMATGIGQLGMTAAETRSSGNYFFDANQVQNFLDARLFGVPLSAFITQPQSEWVAFVKSMNPANIDFTRVDIAIVVVPMMIIASIATHMNSRASVARQPEAALENPQTRMMNMLALWIFPLGILVTGPFFPVAILLYWMSNNIWTYGQQHLVFGRIEKEEEEARLAKQEKLKANAPKPGAKPNRGKKRAEPVADTDESASTDGAVSLAKADDPGDGDAADDEPTQRVIGNKPKPGQKPAKANAGSGGGGSGSGTGPAARKGSGKQGSGSNRRGGGGKRGGRKGGRR